MVDGKLISGTFSLLFMIIIHDYIAKSIVLYNNEPLFLSYHVYTL